MRKSGMRFISAALAACMMASVLPVSAFASGGDGDRPLKQHKHAGGSHRHGAEGRRDDSQWGRIYSAR